MQDVDGSDGGGGGVSNGADVDVFCTNMRCVGKR